MQRIKKKNKIHLKYEDYYTSDDLKDLDMPQRVNLTIDDFDASGKVANPRAPCVVSTIDPDYARNATLQRSSKKFRMKTDLLRLREITRKKFVIYATKQRYLEKQQETAYQDYTYRRITDFQEYAVRALCSMESDSFNNMRETQMKLLDLQKVKINDELMTVIAEHQRVLMEVQEIYGRFLFLLKLIAYFDEIVSPDDNDSNTQGLKLPPPAQIVGIQINERNPVGKKEISNIITYMDVVIRPYLAKRNYLNSDIWIKGYERTRHKIFNYNRRFTQVALLSHLVSIVSDKSKKTFERRGGQTIFLMDSNYLTDRTKFLMKHSLQILSNFERSQIKDKLQLKLNAVVPVILQRIEVNIDANTFSEDNVRKIKNNSKPIIATGEKNSSPGSIQFCKMEANDTLSIVEKLQWHLQSLLQDLENYAPQKCKQIELHVRKYIVMKKETSRRALVKQSRLQNWMEHFRKHEALRISDL